MAMLNLSPTALIRKRFVLFWSVLRSNDQIVRMIQWIFHFVKFQPKGLPYTPEQWAPNNPDGEDYMI